MTSENSSIPGHLVTKICKRSKLSSVDILHLRFQVVGISSCNLGLQGTDMCAGVGKSGAGKKGKKHFFRDMFSIHQITLTQQ